MSDVTTVTQSLAEKFSYLIDRNVNPNPPHITIPKLLVLGDSITYTDRYQNSVNYFFTDDSSIGIPLTRTEAGFYLTTLLAPNHRDGSITHVAVPIHPSIYFQIANPASELNTLIQGNLHQ